MSRVPTQGIDYTNKDYEAFREMMLKELSVKMPEYTDRRQTDAGIVILELNAQGLDIISYYQDVLANEVYLSTAEQRNNALKWCRMLSYTPRNSSPSKFKQVFVLSSVQSTSTVIPEGTVVKTQGSSIENEVRFETVKDLIIPAGKLGNETDEEGEYLYAVDIVQGTTVSSELLGTSTNTADQRFTLNYTPVIVDSIVVLVNEGSGFEKWERVDNFVESTPTSKHYVVSITDGDEAIITFGNGVFGKIPVKYSNGLYCEYRVGGGTVGNVGAFKINTLDSNLALVEETFNPELAFVSGQDKESLEDIKLNAPIANRTLWGALTEDDFAGVVKMNFPDVLFSDAVGSDTDVDDLDIYLLLKENAPLTEPFKKEILALFDENSGGRKIVGARTITLKPAEIVPLDLEYDLIIKSTYSREEIESQIDSFLEDYFEIGNYPFNKELSLTELASSVMNPENAIAGIKSFKFLVPNEDVLVPDVGQIFTLGEITTNTVGGV